VLITTKKGKQGRSSITYDGYTGISQIRKKLDLLSPEEFRSYTKEDGTKLLDLGASVDWQDEVFTTGVTQSHSLSYSGVRKILLIMPLWDISTRRVSSNRRGRKS
jgi:iron complex outermembrane receptor protein